MRSAIGGKLGCDAYRLLADCTDSRLRSFVTMNREQQAAAIRRMASEGRSDHTIATATRLSVEQIRRILAEPRPATSESDPC